MNNPAVICGEVVITNPTGLHARPAVKLTKLAKSFAAVVRLRVGREASGPTPRASPACWR